MDRLSLNDNAACTHLGADVPAYQVEVVRDVEGMLRLRPDWERLSAACPQPNAFSTFAWFWAWWNYVAPHQHWHPRRLHILVICRNDTVTGIFPLMLRLTRRGPISLRKLEFIGGGDLAAYQSPVYADDLQGQTQAVAVHLAAMRTEWDFLELHNLRPEIGAVLRRTFEQHLNLQLVPAEECAYFPLPDSWDALLRSRSPLTRQTFFKKRNRLLRQQIRVRIIECPDSEPDLLERMIELEGRKMVHGKPAFAQLARWPEFHASLLHELGGTNWLGIAVMEKGSKLIAYVLFFRCGTGIGEHAKAYDAGFAKLSPGLLLLGELVDYACQRGHGEYDFLRGTQSHKMEWAKGVRRICHLQVWHGGRRSQIASLMLRASSKSKRMLHKIGNLQDRVTALLCKRKPTLVAAG
jgi:CelD/BcsL family acetyltransferase involved in cellulose biosynthesis